MALWYIQQSDLGVFKLRKELTNESVWLFLVARVWKHILID